MTADAYTRFLYNRDRQKSAAWWFQNILAGMKPIHELAPFLQFRSALELPMINGLDLFQVRDHFSLGTSSGVPRDPIDGRKPFLKMFARPEEMATGNRAVIYEVVDRTMMTRDLFDLIGSHDGFERNALPLQYVWWIVAGRYDPRYAISGVEKPVEVLNCSQETDNLFLHSSNDEQYWVSMKIDGNENWSPTSLRVSRNNRKLAVGTKVVLTPAYDLERVLGTAISESAE